MIKFVEDLKRRHKNWSDKRFLKKHGVDTWEQYKRKYDPLIRGSYPNGRIKDWYHGYLYVFAFTDASSNSVWYKFGDFLQGLTVIKEWCKENCVGKYRYDLIEVIRIGDDWHENSLGASVIFFAFTDEQDFILFSLKWS